jgi:hypothetical protein
MASTGIPLPSPGYVCIRAILCTLWKIGQLPQVSRPCVHPLVGSQWFKVSQGISTASRPAK